MPAHRLRRAGVILHAPTQPVSPHFHDVGDVDDPDVADYVDVDFEIHWSN